MHCAKCFKQNRCAFGRTEIAECADKPRVLRQIQFCARVLLCKQGNVRHFVRNLRDGHMRRNPFHRVGNITAVRNDAARIAYHALAQRIIETIQRFDSQHFALRQTRAVLTVRVAHRRNITLRVAAIDSEPRDEMMQDQIVQHQYAGLI